MSTIPQKIKLLPVDLTNQIAAGEVVERPASVLKELVENALDAKATEVIVTIENGGQSLIRVQDNGMGIASTELELAVTRHATSKLQDIAGLSEISSYGFRGEALPSIASVSKFRIVSKASQEYGQELHNENTQSLSENSTHTEKSNDLENQENKADIKNTDIPSEAFELNVEFGKVQEIVPSSLRHGTLIEVKDLFFNIPARLKFLKNPSTELKRATDLFIRLALIAENASLSLYAGTRLSHTFSANENLKERLAHIWPPTVVEALLPVSYAAYGVEVTGFISHPRSHQPRADRMLFYVNDRAVSDKLLMRAVRQAFHGKITTRDYPQCILCVKLAPQDVDVNVHPAKNEVRFRDEQSLFTTVMRSVSNALENDDHNFSVKELFGENRASDSNQNSDGYGGAHHNGHENQNTQNARLGDLYAPKPQGFWGNADKETGLSFIKENAEKQRMQNAYETSVYTEQGEGEKNTAQDWHVNTNIPASSASPVSSGSYASPASSGNLNPSTTSDYYINASNKMQEPAQKIQAFSDNSTDYSTGNSTGDSTNNSTDDSTGDSLRSFSTSISSVSNTANLSEKSYEQNAQRSLERVNEANECDNVNSIPTAALPAGIVYLGQIAETYLILKKSSDALILLDQHAVHERILYEQTRKGQIHSQNLLVPIEIPLHKSEQERMQDLLPQLKKLAFHLSFSKQSCVVSAIPTNLSRVSATAFLKDLLAEKTDDLERIWIHHACSSAIKAHTSLDTAAALNLITQWLNTEEPDYCPHGRPCALHFDELKLEQMFKRRQ